jgi:hypothetical protein
MGFVGRGVERPVHWRQLKRLRSGEEYEAAAIQGGWGGFSLILGPSSGSAEPCKANQMVIWYARAGNTVRPKWLVEPFQFVLPKAFRTKLR